jgi:outer membrane protein assembly complex protein YaeT
MAFVALGRHAAGLGLTARTRSRCMPGRTTPVITVRRARPWTFWVGASAVSLLSITPAYGQFPANPQPQPPGLPSLIPSLQKDPNALLNANLPPTPTLVIPTTRSPEMLGLSAESTGQVITQIHFTGNRRMSSEQLKNQISSREGQPLNPEKVRNDVRLLDSTARYIGGVRVEEYKTNEGIVLTFHVVERAMLDDVVYLGARHATREELETHSGLKKGMPMSVALNRVAARKLEEFYHTQGRYYAQVHLVEGGRPEDNRVVFQITEGPKVSVKSVNLVGAHFVTSTRLKYGSKMETSDMFFGLFGSNFNPMEIEQDITKIIDYYRGFGFFDVKVRKSVKPSTDPGYVEITVVVEEGPRYMVRDVRVGGNNKLNNEILLAHNTLKQGEYYNAQAMQAGLRQMQDEYGRRGIINTKVQPEFAFAPEPGTVTVVYKVDEGPGVSYAGTIEIVGNTVTRDDVIREQLRFFPGQVLDATKIRESERNLGRLGIFKTDPATGVAPRIYLADAEVPSPYKTVIVQVEEDRTGSLNIGAAVGSDAGINAQISLTERNFDILRPPTSLDDIFAGRAFRGGGQTFNITAQPGNEFSNYAVSWTEPSIFNSDYSLSLAGYFRNRFFNEYHEERTGARVSVGKRLSDEWFFNVGFRAEAIDVKSVAVGAPIDYTSVLGNNSLYAPRISFIRDTRDSFLRATEGNKFEIAFEQAFGSYTFPLFSVEDSQYFTMYQRPDGSGRQVLVFHGVMGISGHDTPVYERYFAGGARSIRGFAFRGVGPDKNGFKVGGNFELIGNIEYQIPLEASDRFYAVAFCDFGTVEDDIAIRDFRVSVGAGLRISMPMLSPAPIALDFGFPLMKKDTDDKQVFSFTVSLSY